MHYLTLARFLQNLQFSAKNGTKNAQILQNSYKICIVPLKEILKKVVSNQIIRKIMRAMNDTISIYSTLAFCNKRILSREIR